MKNQNNNGTIGLLKQLRKNAVIDEDNKNNTSTIDKYINNLKKTNEIKTLEKQAPEDSNVYNNILEIDTSHITRWKYKDRPEDELGDIEGLAKTFQDIGQQQPCILRPFKDGITKYELIAGERRWKAAQLIGFKLKSIVQNIDDKTAALIQAVENEKRKGISDYAKGMSFTDKIKNGLIKQCDIVDILGISKQQVSRLLSFDKIHPSVKLAISDFRKVSARTAEELRRLSNKSEDHCKAIIALSDKIRDGKVGASFLNKQIQNIITTKGNNNSEKIRSTDGRHLFTWRLDNNLSPSIHFPNDIIKLINDKSIILNDLSDGIREVIVNKLKLASAVPVENKK